MSDEPKSKREVCPECGGAGYLLEHPDVAPSGEIRCHRCGGMGRLGINPDCNLCGGEGFLADCPACLAWGGEQRGLLQEAVTALRHAAGREPTGNTITSNRTWWRELADRIDAELAKGAE